MTTQLILLAAFCMVGTEAPSQDTGKPSPKPGNAPREVYVEIPEVFELANIAIAISEEGLKHPNRVHKQGAYYQRVLAHFLPFKGHPLIAQPDLHRNSTYLFRDNSAAYVFDGDRIVHGGVYPPMRRPDLFTRHLAAVEDFAKVSDFRRFYRDNLGYYQEQVRRYEQKVPLRRMGQWLEDRFPIRSHRFKVIFSPLLGSSHETCGFETNGIKESIMFVCGPGEPGEDDDPVGDALLAKTVFTEIDHNYVNPTTARFSRRVGDTFGDFTKWSHPENKDSYPAPEMTFNEYMTWAVFLLYARDTYDPQTFASVKSRIVNQMVQQRNFGRFQEFSDELLRLYSIQTQDRSVTNLYPLILDWAAK